MERLTERSGVNLMVLIFGLIYLGFNFFVIEPELYLMQNYREFFTDYGFFSQFFHFPGYLSDYVSRFLIGFYNFRAISSVMLTCLIALAFFLTTNLAGSKKGNYLSALFPLMILLVMHNDYDHDIKNDFILICLLAALNAWLWLVRRNSKYEIAVCALLLAGIVFFNGLVAAAFWILYVLVILMKQKATKIRLLWHAGSVVVVAIIFRIIFSLTIHDFIQELTDMMRFYSFPMMPFVLYLSVLFPLVAPELIGRLIPGKFQEKPAWIASSAMVFVCLTILLSFHLEQKNELKVKYFGLKHDWEKVLEFSKKCSNPDRNVSFFTNAALFHTGKISTDLFSYNQGFGSDGLIAPEITDYTEVVTNQDIFLQMGALSLSVVWGTEATNLYGVNPIVLKNLVKAYLAEGQIKEARKFLNLLNHSLFCKNWVARYQQFIDNPALIDRDPELSHYRHLQLPKAEVFAKNVEMNLYLLSSNAKTNRMAYDYLVISTLLDNRMNDFATCLTGLKTYGYNSLPKVYMEGLLYYSLLSNDLPIDPHEFTFDNRVAEQFAQFRKELAAQQNNLPSASKNLQNKYGDTYWYYILFESRISDEERRDILTRMIG